MKKKMAIKLVVSDNGPWLLAYTDSGGVRKPTKDELMLAAEMYNDLKHVVLAARGLRRYAAKMNKLHAENMDELDSCIEFLDSYI